MVDALMLKKTILEDNDRDADTLREKLMEEGILYINIMSSPGSGKTSVLTRLINLLHESHPEIKIGVMEADIDSDVDAEKIRQATGVTAVQLHTGGMCHLDADMSRQGLRFLDEESKKQNIERLDIVFLENVGNLVCPAEFDTGAHIDICILAVPEGDDKPLKYPLIFEKSKAVIINKIDTTEIFDFDIEKAGEGIKMRNKDAEIFPVSARTGEGFRSLADWLLLQL